MTLVFWWQWVPVFPSRVKSRATLVAVCPGFWTRPGPTNGPLLCDIIITRPLVYCIVLSPEIKETDAGATSRALPTGNRPPLKAWQGGGGQENPLLCVFFWKSGYESGWGEWVIALFFHLSFFKPLSPSFSTLSDNIKNCTAILCSILIYTAATTIIHTLKRFHV